MNNAIISKPFKPIIKCFHRKYFHFHVMMLIVFSANFLESFQELCRIWYFSSVHQCSVSDACAFLLFYSKIIHRSTRRRLMLIIRNK